MTSADKRPGSVLFVCTQNAVRSLIGAPTLPISFTRLTPAKNRHDSK